MVRIRWVVFLSVCEELHRRCSAPIALFASDTATPYVLLRTGHTARNRLHHFDHSAEWVIGESRIVSRTGISNLFDRRASPVVPHKIWLAIEALRSRVSNAMQTRCRHHSQGGLSRPWLVLPFPEVHKRSSSFVIVCMGSRSLSISTMMYPKVVSFFPE